MNCAGPATPPGLKPRLNALRVAAKARFGVEDWMDGAEAERVLAKPLTYHADKPVTAGNHATEDGTECGHLLRVLFQTEPLAWEARLVDVTFTNAEGRPVMMPWLEEEQGPFARF